MREKDNKAYNNESMCSAFSSEQMLKADVSNYSSIFIELVAILKLNYINNVV